MVGPLFGSAAVDAVVSDGAWLCSMLEVEAALAAAGAGAGVVPPAAAAEIAAACRDAHLDVDEIGRGALATGNPVVPLVAALEALLPADARPHLHRGATSQDVVDTALMLVARRALELIAADLGAAGDRCAALAEAHRDTPMAARTLLQQALPTTFGLRAAGWMVAVDSARSGLERVRDQRLAVQLGGAAGTLASLGDAGLEVARRLAAELGLAEPLLPWHTDRVRVAELAAALGTAAGALGKVALDVVLLAQTEVGEVGEAEGGSSTLPQKRNPVHAVLTGAAARRAPELLRVTGGAAAHGRAMLEALRVYPARMRANLGARGGMLMAESVAGRLAPALGRGAAHALVRDRVRSAEERGVGLREVLVNDPAVREHLSEEGIDAALDPAAHLGPAGALVDRALRAHRAGITAPEGGR
ncbi:MAG: 3-carboxy-cis,cis-muconate cycloisomerase [Chloroflexi bacterium]|nr:MAG: 3-carboxy-cis,cis-muconate cycloisomerase [Chloroflexota bacterium]